MTKQTPYSVQRDRVLAMAPQYDESARDDCRHCISEGKACGRAHFENIAYEWQVGQQRASRAVTGAELNASFQQERRQGGYKPAGSKPVRKASEKQLNFVRKLLGEKDLAGTAYGKWDDALLGSLSSIDASRAIDDLLTKPRKPVTAKPSAGNLVTEDGWYTKDGEVYKVQRAVHGSGNLYAKKLLLHWTGEFNDNCDKVYDGAAWEYAPGAVRQLRASDKLTLEQAKQFGKLYGVCMCCGATLTNEDSIEAGIGPICAQKFA